MLEVADATAINQHRVNYNKLSLLNKKIKHIKLSNTIKFYVFKFPFRSRGFDNTHWPV